MTRHRIAKSETGLSPRVRGNLLEENKPENPNGSIPACAGEPLSAIPARRNEGVYPRVCGGTLVYRPGPVPTEGLSPRVRGNLDFNWATASSFVSGLSPRVRGNRPSEPVVSSVNLNGVYPRVCGGTFSKLSENV